MALCLLCDPDAADAEFRRRVEHSKLALAFPQSRYAGETGGREPSECVLQPDNERAVWFPPSPDIAQRFREIHLETAIEMQYGTLRLTAAYTYGHVC